MNSSLRIRNNHPLIGRHPVVQTGIPHVIRAAQIPYQAQPQRLLRSPPPMPAECMLAICVRAMRSPDGRVWNGKAPKNLDVVKDEHSRLCRLGLRWGKCRLGRSGAKYAFRARSVPLVLCIYRMQAGLSHAHVVVEAPWPCITPGRILGCSPPRLGRQTLNSVILSEDNTTCVGFRPRCF